jgi:hypothetical protein
MSKCTNETSLKDFFCQKKLFACALENDANGDDEADERGDRHEGHGGDTLCRCTAGTLVGRPRSGRSRVRARAREGCGGCGRGRGGGVQCTRLVRLAGRDRWCWVLAKESKVNKMYMWRGTVDVLGVGWHLHPGGTC